MPMIKIIKVQAQEEDVVEINWVDKDGKVLVESRTAPKTIKSATASTSTFRVTQKDKE